MTGHFPDLFVRQVMHAASLRDDVTDEFMALLEPAFLVGLVRITVKHAGPSLAVGSHLNGPGILEFRSVVCQNDPGLTRVRSTAQMMPVTRAETTV